MKIMKFRYFIGALLVIASLMFTGCPKADKTVRQLREKSAELSVHGTKLIQAFGDAYKAGEITQDELAKVNRVTASFVRAVGIYRQALQQAERVVKENPDMTAIQIKDLEKILDDQVISAFFNILAGVGVMSVSQSEIIKTILSGIRLTILTLRSAFSDARYQMRQYKLEVSDGRFA